MHDRGFCEWCQLYILSQLSTRTTTVQGILVLSTYAYLVNVRVADISYSTVYSTRNSVYTGCTGTIPALGRPPVRRYPKVGYRGYLPIPF